MNKYPLLKKQSFFHRNFSFSGTMTRAAFWSDMGMRVIGLLCAAVLLCILIAVALPGSTEQLITFANVAISILSVVWVIPMIAMTRRRLRDAGYSAKSYLWLLVPCIGAIVFLVRLFTKSAEPDTDKSSFNY